MSIVISHDLSLALTAGFAALASGAATWALGRRRREGAHKRLLAEIGTLEEAQSRLAQTVEDLANRLVDAEAGYGASADLMTAMTGELRMRLKAIVAFSDLIRQEMLGPVGNRAYVDHAGVVYANGERLMTIVSDSLELAKAQSGTLALKNDTVDPRLLVRKCVQMTADEASRCGVRVIETYGPDLPLLRLDDRRVTKVLHTVLGHAIAASHTGAEVYVETHGDESGLAVAVSFPGVSAVTGEPEATMGLAAQTAPDRDDADNDIAMRLCRRLMTLHGGTLTLGSGATGIRFPADRTLPTLTSKAASF